jgi:hypothetical protein
MRKCREQLIEVVLNDVGACRAIDGDQLALAAPPKLSRQLPPRRKQQV